MKPSSLTRGLGVVKTIENIVKNKPKQFDTKNILNRIQFTSASGGCLKGTFKVESDMCNVLDSLHGGYIAAVMDTVAMYGCVSREDGGFAWTTSLQVNYIKSAVKGEKIQVETKPLKSGRTLVMETILSNDVTGDLIAKGTICLQIGSQKFQDMAMKITEPKEE